MTLDTAWQIEQTWGGAQAVLKGVVHGLNPFSVIECGCGNFSTPLLRAHVDILLTIEHDQPWAKKIQKRFPSNWAHQYLIHTVPGVNNGTDPEELEPETLQSIQDFYNALAGVIEPAEFLLVDTYRCARVPAAQALASKVRMVMLHDARPQSRTYYHYHKLDNLFSDWHRYEHRPKGFINCVHAIPWTALYSKAPLNLESMQPFIIEESERLWGMKVGLEEIHGA